MKNYLVKSLFNIKSTEWGFRDRSGEENLYENYLDMHRVSLSSCKQFLRGDWDFKFLSGNCEEINQAFEKTFWGIYDLWHSEPCNIFYVDPDVLVFRDVEPWGKYENFTMFNYTDPREFHNPNIYNKEFDHFFNAGVRYFPSTMSEDIWKIGAEMARKWDHTTYDTEQIILNTMLWAQGVSVNDVLEPTMAWQAFLPPEEGEEWNGCPINEAKAFHFHGSRNAQDRASTMKQLAKRIGLDC